MSFVQVCAAWVNCLDLVSMLEGMERLTRPPGKVGSGKLVMPCDRMQAAALR
jgi:hypothetical protein